MRTHEYTVYSDGKRADHVPQHEPPARQRRRRRAARARPGSSRKAGYCLATLLRLPQSGQQVAVVVLGARSNAGRFMESRNLFNWVSAKASTLFAAKPPPTQQLSSSNGRSGQGVEISTPPVLARHSPRCIAAASSGSVAIVSTATITGRVRVRRVVRLQVPPADVARVDAVAAVARRERRDQRAVVVGAERAGERREAPLRRRSARRSAADRRSA